MEVKNKETITNLPILLCDKCKCVPLIKFTTPENSDIRIKYTCRCGEKDNTLSECFSMLSNNQMKIEEDNCKTCEKGNAEHFCEKCKKTFCVQCEYKHFEHKIIKEDVLMNYIRTEKRKEFNTEGYHKLIKVIEEKTKNIISLINKRIERNTEIINYIDILSNTFDKQNCNNNLIMNACSLLHLSPNDNLNLSKFIESLNSLSEELSKNSIAQVQKLDNATYIETFKSKEMITLIEKKSMYIRSEPAAAVCTEHQSRKHCPACHDSSDNRKSQPEQLENKISYMNETDGILLIGCQNGRVCIRERDKTIFDSQVHSKAINYIVYTKDNLITCSYDKKIIITPLPFETSNQIPLIDHEDIVNKVIVFHDNKIISCSNDRTIIIWEKNSETNAYDSIQVLEHKDWVNSILDIENNSKHYLVSGSAEEDPSIIFWALGVDNKFKEEKRIEQVECCYRDSMKQVSNDILLVGGLCQITIINLSVFEVVHTVNIETRMSYILDFMPMPINKDAVLVLSNNSMLYCNYIKKFSYELNNKNELLGLFKSGSNIVSYNQATIIEWDIK